jgi:hypothetical protein
MGDKPTTIWLERKSVGLWFKVSFGEDGVLLAIWLDNGNTASPIRHMHTAIWVGLHAFWAIQISANES